MITRRAAFIAASLEHAVRAARSVGALPEELAQVLSSVLDATWSGQGDAQIAEHADALADQLSDALSTDLASLARAAAHLARSDVEGPRALNLIDDFVDQADPEGELGIEEEAVWREHLEGVLSSTPEPITRAAVESHLASTCGWLARWAEDWNA